MRQSQWAVAVPDLTRAAELSGGDPEQQRKIREELKVGGQVGEKC